MASESMSQSEIDELLMRMMSGGPLEDSQAAPKDNVYDFTRPLKFNKDQLRSLQNIFDNYSRTLSTFLTGYLRTSVQIEFVGAPEQQIFQEFINSLANPTIIAITEMHPLEGQIILQLSADLGYTIIDRIEGGPGLNMKKMRDFTEMEHVLIRSVLDRVVKDIPEAWASMGTFSAQIDRIETNPQFAQIYHPSEMTALVSLNVKIGNVEGLMTFCIPFIVIKPILDKMSTRFGFTNPQDKIENKHQKNIESKLEHTDVSVCAQIGRTRITVNEFVNLQIGDVITLDSFTNSDIKIMVGKVHRYYAKPGVNKGKNAVQITRLVEGEE